MGEDPNRSAWISVVLLQGVWRIFIKNFPKLARDMAYTLESYQWWRSTLPQGSKTFLIFGWQAKRRRIKKKKFLSLKSLKRRFNFHSVLTPNIREIVFSSNFSGNCPLCPLPSPPITIIELYIGKHFFPCPYISSKKRTTESLILHDFVDQLIEVKACLRSVKSSLSWMLGPNSGLDQKSDEILEITDPETSNPDPLFNFFDVS